MKRFVGVGVVGGVVVAVAASAAASARRRRDRSRRSLAGVPPRPRAGRRRSWSSPSPGEEADVAAALAAAGHAWRVRRAGRPAAARGRQPPVRSTGPAGAWPHARRRRPWPRRAGRRVGRPSGRPPRRRRPASPRRCQRGRGRSTPSAPPLACGRADRAGHRLAVIDTGFGDWDAAAAAGDVAAESFDRPTTSTSATPASSAPTTAPPPRRSSTTWPPTSTCCGSASTTPSTSPRPCRGSSRSGVQRREHVPRLLQHGPGDGQGGPGSPDQSVRQAMAAGIQWVNSAGNEAQLHYGGAFTDADGDGAPRVGCRPADDELHPAAEGAGRPST